MPKGRWFDLRDLPFFILQMEEKQGVMLKEYRFVSGAEKSNIELTFVNQIKDGEMRLLISRFIESKNKQGLEILKESDFCVDQKDQKCFEFRYKNYAVLVVFTNDTEYKPRKIYITCHKYPLPYKYPL